MRGGILAACYEEPTPGHYGHSRILARVRQQYYWPRLSTSLHRYVKGCRECQRRKTPLVKAAGLVQPIASPRTPFDFVGMNLLGLLRLSPSGIKWIIVATDHLNCYAETKVLPRGTACKVAKFLVHHIVLRDGCPSCVITDRGGSFTAQMIEDMLKLSCRSHRKITAYHPQTNELTERLNKAIAEMLSIYVDVQHKTWEDILL